MCSASLARHFGSSQGVSCALRRRFRQLRSMHHPPRHPCRQLRCPMRDRAPIPAPIVALFPHTLASLLSAMHEESAQLSSAPRGGRQPDRHLLPLRTSAGSSSSRKRCARLTMSIAVCVRVSAVQYAHVPPACSCCSAALLLTPPTTYRLLSAAYRLRPAGCRLLPTPTTYRLPPAACACACRLCSCAAYVPPAAA